MARRRALVSTKYGSDQHSSNREPNCHEGADQKAGLGCTANAPPEGWVQMSMPGHYFLSAFSTISTMR